TIHALCVTLLRPTARLHRVDLVALARFVRFTHAPTNEIYTLSLHDALPIFRRSRRASMACARGSRQMCATLVAASSRRTSRRVRSEEHTSELQSRGHLVCRLLLEKKKPPGHARRSQNAATIIVRSEERTCER